MVDIWYDTLGYTGTTADESIGQTGGASGRGEAPYNSSSTMIGKVCGTLKIPMKKVGSPSGTAYARVVHKSTNATRLELGSIDVSTLDTAYTTQIFSAGSTVTLNQTDTVAIVYTGGDSSNYISIKNAATQIYDGSNSGKSYYFTSWNVDTKDMIAYMSDETDVPPASGGLLFPPPYSEVVF